MILNLATARAMYVCEAVICMHVCMCLRCINVHARLSASEASGYLCYAPSSSMYLALYISFLLNSPINLPFSFTLTHLSRPLYLSPLFPVVFPQSYDRSILVLLRFIPLIFPSCVDVVLPSSSPFINTIAVIVCILYTTGIPFN